MTDEERENYLKVVNIICEQFGLNKPNQIIYVCEAVENLIEPYMKENAELKEKYESNKNPIETILELKSQIVKLNEYAHSICKNYTGEKKYKHQNCKHHWDCSDCINWEMK